MLFSLLTSVLLFASTAFSAPITIPETSPIPFVETELFARQSATTCGSTYYTAAQVRQAVAQGVNYMRNGQQVGNNRYPHRFNNREGFDFVVSGPYQNCPLLRSGPYTGGSPGPDRVVFNDRGQWGGTITHTGASNHGFVGCSGTR